MLTLRSFSPLELDREVALTPEIAQQSLERDVRNSNPITRGWNAAGLAERAGDIAAEVNAAHIAGDIPRMQMLRDQLRMKQQEAATWTPEVNELQKVKSLRDGMEYLGYGLGNLRSSVPAIAGALGGRALGAGLGALSPIPGGAAIGGVVGGWLGGTGAGYNMEANETLVDAYSTPAVYENVDPNEILNTARAKGAAASALEAAVPAMLAGKVLGPSAAKITGSRLGHVGKEALKSMPTEFATEGLQNVAGQVAMNSLEREQLSKIDPMAALNEAALGAIGGGAMGGVGGVSDVARNALGAAGEFAKKPVADHLADAAGTAGALAGKGRNLMERVMGGANHKDPDYLRMNAPEISGSDAEVLADHDARTQSALNLAAKITKQPNSFNDDELTAATKFIGDTTNAQSDVAHVTALKEFRTALEAADNKRWRTEGFKEALDDFTKGTTRRASKQGAFNFEGTGGSGEAGKADLKKRAETFGKLTDVLRNKYKHVYEAFGTGFSQDPEARTSAEAMLDWVESGFINRERVTPAAASMWGKDGSSMVEDAFNYLAAEGRIERSPENLATLAKVKNDMEASASNATSLRDKASRLLRGEVQEKMKDKEFGRLHNELRAYANGRYKGNEKAFRSNLEELFGANTDEVLDMYTPKSDKLKLDEGEKTVNEDGEIEQETGDIAGSIQEDRGPQVEGVYGKNEKEKLNLKRKEIAAQGLKSRVTGMWDRLKESYPEKWQADELRDAENQLIREYYPEISKEALDNAGIDQEADRTRMLNSINRNNQVVDSVEPSELEGVDFTDEDVKSMEVDSRKVSSFTAANGAIVVKRKNGGMSTFFTSKLIDRIRNGKGLDNTKAYGAAETYQHLMTALSSLMNSNRGFTNEIGYRETPNGPVKWIKPEVKFSDTGVTDGSRQRFRIHVKEGSLPDNFNLHTSTRMKDVKRAQLEQLAKGDRQGIEFASTPEEKLQSLKNFITKLQERVEKMLGDGTVIVKEQRVDKLLTFISILQQDIDPAAATETIKQRAQLKAQQKKTGDANKLMKQASRVEKVKLSDEQKLINAEARYESLRDAETENEAPKKQAYVKEKKIVGKRWKDDKYVDKDGKFSDDKENAQAVIKKQVGFETETETKHLSEGEEMAENSAVDLPEGDRIPGQDTDMVGQAIPERDITKPVGPQQIEFIKGLLIKGVPAFVAKVKAMTEQQRHNIRAATRELLKTGQLGDLAARAEAALKALRGVAEKQEPGVSREVEKDTNKEQDQRYFDSPEFREAEKRAAAEEAMRSMDEKVENQSTINSNTGSDDGSQRTVQSGERKGNAQAVKGASGFDSPISRRLRKLGLQLYGQIKSGQEVLQNGELGPFSSHTTVAMKLEGDKVFMSVLSPEGLRQFKEYVNSHSEITGNKRADVLANFSSLILYYNPSSGEFTVLGPRLGSPGHKINEKAGAHKGTGEFIKHVDIDQTTGIASQRKEEITALDGVNQAQLMKLLAEFGVRAKKLIGTDVIDANWERLTGWNVGREGRIQFSAQLANGSPITAEQKAEVKAELLKTLGPKISLAFEKIFGPNFITDAHGNKILGPDGKPQREEWSGDQVDGLIRISITALDPLGTSRHEAMHQLISWLKEAKVAGMEELLKNVATNRLVMGQLRRLLKDDAAALGQLSDPEEAAAYLYQFWRAGLINLGPKNDTLFQKIYNFAAKLFGFVAEEVRDMKYAEALMQTFADGKFADGDPAVLRVFESALDHQREKYAGSFWKALTNNKLFNNVAFTAGSVLRDTKIPSLVKLAEQFHQAVGDKTDGQDLYRATAQNRAHYLNKLEEVIKGADPEDLPTVLKHLQSQTPSNKIADQVVRKVVDGIRDYLSGEKDSMYTYMESRKMKRWDDDSKSWVPVPKRTFNYFPQVWDIEKLAANPQGFIERLKKHHAKQLEFLAQQAMQERDKGTYEKDSAAATVKGRDITVDDIAQAIVSRIIISSGAPEVNESTSALGITPLAKSVNKRTLDWIDAKEFTDYMQSDLVQILTNYTVQMVKRGEYTSRFGNEGEKVQEAVDEALMYSAFNGNKQKIFDAKQQLSDQLEAWEKLPETSKQSKSKPTVHNVVEQMAGKEKYEQTLQLLRDPIRAIMAGEGTLGRDIDENLRTLLSGMTTYQNLRLMALSLFSSFVDPLGMIVRGGTMKDSFDGFVRGVKEVAKGWQGKSSQDEMAKLAERLGIVDAHVFLDTLGQTYSSLYMHGKMKRFNDSIFKWNGMESWNRAMRIQATGAAMGFIEKHLSKPGEHSERYLKDELGLDPALKDTYMKDGKLDTENEAVKQAIMKWVDGAILRPNAMQRPIVASDPHYALFYHLKQFAYSFHKTILARAWNEGKHGNLTPAVAMVSTYVPMMIAADVVKALIQPGDEPAWMKGGLGGMVTHGVSRANLFGVPQIGYEALPNPFKMLDDPGRQISGMANLFGPAPNQLVEWALVPMTEKYTIGQEALDAMPVSTLIRQIPTYFD